LQFFFETLRAVLIPLPREQLSTAPEAHIKSGSRIVNDSSLSGVRLTNQSQAKGMNMNKAMQFVLRGLVMATILFARLGRGFKTCTPRANFRVRKPIKDTSPTVRKAGKSVLTLSDDFIVAGHAGIRTGNWWIPTARVSGRQAEDQSVYRIPTTRGNYRRAQLCEERVEGSHLVRVCPRSIWASQL